VPQGTRRAGAGRPAQPGCRRRCRPRRPPRSAPPRGPPAPRPPSAARQRCRRPMPATGAQARAGNRSPGPRHRSHPLAAGTSGRGTQDHRSSTHRHAGRRPAVCARRRGGTPVPGARRSAARAPRASPAPARACARAARSPRASRSHRAGRTPATAAPQTRPAGRRQTVRARRDVTAPPGVLAAKPITVAQPRVRLARCRSHGTLRPGPDRMQCALIQEGHLVTGAIGMRVTAVQCVPLAEVVMTMSSLVQCARNRQSGNAR
jgi:hypothetical protein